VIVWAVRSSSIATAQGICCGSRTWDPPVGMTPQRVSARAKVAWGTAKRRSVPSMNSRPPAMQTPLIAAMIGL
jgi:hypothetical protein